MAPVKRISVGILVWILLMLWSVKVFAGESSLDGFDLTIDVQSNFMSVPNFFSTSGMQEEIRLNKSIPLFIAAKESTNLQIAFLKTEDESLGGFFREIGWLWSSGDTLRFVHDSFNPVNSKVYDLDIRYEKFRTLGLYKQHEYRFAGFSFVLEEDLFACLNYQRVGFVGLGILTSDSANPISITGQFHENTNNSLGWGAGLAGKMKLQLSSDSEFNLQIRNLPGLIYFSNLEFKNGSISSYENGISPIKVEGFIKKDAALILAPLDIKGSIDHTWKNGKVNLEFSALGEVYDVSVGYRYPLEAELNFETKYDLIMENLSIGCIWPQGYINLLFNPRNDWKIYGLVLVFKY